MGYMDSLTAEERAVICRALKAGVLRQPMPPADRRIAHIIGGNLQVEAEHPCRWEVDQTLRRPVRHEDGARIWAKRAYMDPNFTGAFNAWHSGEDNNLDILLLPRKNPKGWCWAVTEAEAIAYFKAIKSKENRA